MNTNPKSWIIHPSIVFVIVLSSMCLNGCHECLDSDVFGPWVRVDSSWRIRFYSNCTFGHDHLGDNTGTFSESDFGNLILLYESGRGEETIHGIVSGNTLEIDDNYVSIGGTYERVCDPYSCDSTPPSHCRMNTGYPCMCDGLVCDDGSLCGRLYSTDYGFCSRPCSGESDYESCQTSDFGLQDYGGGRCLFATEETNNLCATICSYEGEDGMCPDGLSCQQEEFSGITIGVCLP
jgi:hypothetical protein